ncbi:MAG TPA: hypothetical protein VF884_04475 [Nitrososphaeraceae archaeon]
MGFFSECVLTAIELYPVRACTKVYTTDKPIFYRWQFKEKKPTELPTDSSTQIFQSLWEGTLLIKLEEPVEPFRTYEPSCIREINSGIFKRKKGFEFKYVYTAKTPSLLYHVVLPEFCYCDENSLDQQENVSVKILSIDKRQSVTWINVESGWKNRNFELRFIFYGPNEKESKKRQEKTPRKIVVPQEVKPNYKEVKDLGPIALTALGR